MRGGTAVLATVALALAGCGGGERQDAGDKDATYRVRLVADAFPARQHLADETELRIAVRNASRRTIPNLSATIEAGRDGTQAAAFGTLDDQPGLASRSRPAWIVDDGPLGGDTAYANTWALGPLPAGAEKEFVWRVAAIQPGRYRVTYRLSGSLGGRARIVGADGLPVRGSFDVDVDRRPAQARVAADGDVVRVPAP